MKYSGVFLIKQKPSSILLELKELLGAFLGETLWNIGEKLSLRVRPINLCMLRVIYI